MKNKYSALCILAFLCITKISFANDSSKKLYLELRSGISLNSAKESPINDSPSNAKATFGNGYIVGASAGFKIAPDWRVALSIDYKPKYSLTHQSTTNDGKSLFYKTNISSLSSTIDLYYDINKLSYNRFTPYVMAGVGIGINTISDTDFFFANQATGKGYEQSTNNLAWKIGAGVNYSVSDSMYVNFGYTYANLGKVGSKFGKSYPNHDPSLEVDPDVVEHYNQVLQSNSIPNNYKKLTSHSFMVGLGFKF